MHMRISTSLVASLLSLPLLLAACGGHDDDHGAFDTLQACYDDHVGGEALTPQKAIVTCCLEHPIGSSGVHPSCTNTKADCVTHVRAELSNTVSSTDIDAACTTYISMK
jgi:hypothetical protein